MMLVMLVSMTCLLMQLAGHKRDNIEWSTWIRGELHAPNQDTYRAPSSNHMAAAHMMH
jgi:hypothetical protein